jgi:hypothetical protein
MQLHSQKDIQYEVVRTEVVSGQEIHLFLDVLPTHGSAVFSDAQMRRAGIVHPAKSRATTAAMLWMTSLYAEGGGPLGSAWASFCGSRQTPMPFALFTYDIRVTAPPLPPTKNVTVAQPMQLTPYDGPTQTTT